MPLGPCVPMLFQGKNGTPRHAFSSSSTFTPIPVSRGPWPMAAGVSSRPLVGNPSKSLILAHRNVSAIEARLARTRGAIDADMLEWYRDVIALRREYAMLTDGRRDAIATGYDEAAKWLVIERALLLSRQFVGSHSLHHYHREVPRGMLIASSPDVRVEAEVVFLPGNSISVLGPRDEAL